MNKKPRTLSDMSAEELRRLAMRSAKTIIVYLKNNIYECGPKVPYLNDGNSFFCKIVRVSYPYLDMVIEHRSDIGGKPDYSLVSIPCDYVHCIQDENQKKQNLGFDNTD